jgi:hypothetical protein
MVGAILKLYFESEKRTGHPNQPGFGFWNRPPNQKKVQKTAELLPLSSLFSPNSSLISPLSSLHAFTLSLVTSLSSPMSSGQGSSTLRRLSPRNARKRPLREYSQRSNAQNIRLRSARLRPSYHRGVKGPAQRRQRGRALARAGSSLNDSRARSPGRQTRPRLAIGGPEASERQRPRLLEYTHGEARAGSLAA